MIILYILEFLGLLLLILLAALLFIPFGYMFVGKKYEAVAVRSNVSWLFGLVMVTFKKNMGSKGYMVLQLCGLNFKLKPQEKKNREKGKEKEKGNKKKNRKKPTGILRFFNKEFTGLILKAFIDLFNIVKPKRFYLEGRFGFEDPYHTGIASALLNILRQQLRMIPINAHAVFDEEVLEGKLLISGRIMLIRVVYIALKLYLNKHVRSLIKPKEEKSYVI